MKKGMRGRYKKGEIPLKEKRFQVKFEPVQDAIACNRGQERCGLFVNPERIVAFGYILLMAAQVYTILERIVRKNLEKPDEGPVEGLNRRVLMRA